MIPTCTLNQCEIYIIRVTLVCYYNLKQENHCVVFVSKLNRLMASAYIYMQLLQLSSIIYDMKPDEGDGLEG